ncbi:glycosyltransferase family 2 protein [Flavobacterium sp. FZUC8N2.13]|uniref:Glycosyltransferase family 2 protein n=1 Tax=Flavobacterium zubiriense TaxID=3138075 RepID=A0ABV4T776_9FLAO
MNPIISIIIPCYNSEATLNKTFNSVIEQEFQNWEALIINDGSTDDTEKIALEWVNKDNRFKYFSKQNEGLGKTRNFGINKATGTYILPLDSDNLIERDFIQDAINVFENNPEIGVVHGHAEYFGEQTGIWKVDDYQLEKILVHNYIDACAIYKKELWKKVGGYDQNMPHQGHEDWDFWIALGIHGVKFYHLKKITFKYYVSSSSMIRSFSENMLMSNQEYIVKKYNLEYHLQYCKAILLIQKNEEYFRKKLKSKKIVINLFTNMFLGFVFFKDDVI